MKVLIVIASLLLLGGCATNGQAPWTSLLSPSSCSKLSSEQELALNLADDLANDGKLHASLANLESLPDNLSEVRLRKAKVYRLLGRSEAEPLYRSLVGGCLTACARPCDSARADLRGGRLRGLPPGDPRGERGERCEYDKPSQATHAAILLQRPGRRGWQTRNRR